MMPKPAVDEDIELHIEDIAFEPGGATHLHLHLVLGRVVDSASAMWALVLNLDLWGSPGPGGSWLGSSLGLLSTAPGAPG